MGILKSDVELFQFQAEGAARCYLRSDNLVCWDTGLGKSILSVSVSALLFADDLIDHVLVVCEQNKMREWAEDFERFTDLSVVVYHGTPKKRADLRADLPQVVITTYETARNDAVRPRGGSRRALDPHHLTIALEGSRVLVVMDEATKLGNRASKVYRAHEFLIKHLRKHGSARTMALTATPITRSPESLWNLGRILDPQGMGTVEGFERDHIVGRDYFGNIVGWKNLGESSEAGVLSLSDKFGGVMLRKRKTDADVIEQFPDLIEEFVYVDLSPREREFYNTIRALDDGDPTTQAGVFTMLRQVSNHPMALLASHGELAKAVVEQVGAEGLEALGASKRDRLVELLTPLTIGQGAQALVFSFFGPSVLPLLHKALTEAGIGAALHYGAQSSDEKEAAKAAFRSGDVQVLLTSDSGARGINLPSASYVVEYEASLTHATRTQRLNRASRINSTHETLNAITMVTRNTVEEGIIEVLLRRNEWHDQILDGDLDEVDGGARLTAEVRRGLIHWARDELKISDER